jgi:amino acid adenylation domain-containing protein
LAGYEELASIPHKSGASGLNASPYAQQYQRINDADSTRLRKLASKFGVTLNSLIHTIWGVLLSRYCGNKDVVFGTVSMGRPHEIKDVEKMVGLFINTLPLRIRFDNETLFSELSRFVQSDLVMQESKSYVSLADIQREHPLSGLLFDHILIFNYPLGNDSDKDNYNDGILEKLNFSISNLSSRERTNYGLNVTVSAAQEIVFKFSYDTSMYDEVFIQAIGKHIQYIVEQVLEREAIKLGEIKIVTDYERKGIVSTLRGYDDTSIIKETFLSQIERNVIDHPHQTAIVYNGRVITYQELNGKANALAKELIALGTKPGSLVAVVINRSLELPVSLLAVLKSGAAFIPIDSHWPLNRIKEILENVSENIAIVNDAALGRQLEHKNVLHVDFDKLSIETVNPSVQVELTDPIYCIFTSGSTGKPKGVINKHIGIINRFLYMDKRYKPVDTDVVLLTSNHTFDSAVWQLFWPLKNGIKVIIPGDSQLLDLEEIIQLIDKYQVTISDFVPSVFNVLVQWMEERPDYRAKLESLRQLLIGGEAMNAKHIYQFKSYFKNISITNTYGPTEASIGTIFFEVPTEYTEPIPIGRPIDNVHVLLLDRDGDLVPKGVAGEIYLGGLCTGQGYLNDLEKTNQVFVYAPVKEYSNEVFYRTGDRARLLPNGDIEFIGRIDNQLKVRGVRIELGEIESKILLHPDVHEVVVLHEVSGLKTELEAFVVGKEDFDVRALREFLLQYLPEVMIPSKFSLIEKIPISTNGKVDRRALRLLSSKIVDEQKNQTEGTELEMKIAAVWKEVLSINSAGLDDHFFELGGNSIDILRLHSKLKKEINFTESLVRLIQYPTIRSLANFLLKGLVENTTPDAQVKSRNKRKNDHRQRRKKVHEIQHEQYEIHGSNYVERIKNRTKYLSLDVEDEAIQKIMHQLKFNNNSVLIDAGCGTGDRLRTLLDKVPSILNDFPVRYGIDFSSTMIEQAGHKTIGENQLYDELLLDDLTSMSNSLQGDLVLCLWCIINECLDKYPLVLKNLSAMVKPGGYLIFDITTIKASEGYSKFDSVTRALHPEYDADSNDTLYLIKREDATLFYLKLFSKEEINQFEKILEMELCTLSGYGHLNSQLDQLPIDAKTNKNIDFAKEYSGLVLCFRKPLH